MGKMSVCCVLSRSVASDSVTLCTAAGQAPLSMGSPGQEHWSGLPAPPPGALPGPGIKPIVSCMSCTGGFFTTDPPGKPWAKQ